MHLHGMDSYEYIRILYGCCRLPTCTYRRVRYGVNNHSLLSKYRHTITYGCLRLGLSYTSAISVMNGILSAIAHIRLYVCVSVRICAFRVRLAFSNVLLRIAVTLLRIDFDFSFVPDFSIFSNIARASKRPCGYNMHSYG